MSELSHSSSASHAAESSSAAPPDNAKLLAAIQQLEQRLDRLERYLGFQQDAAATVTAAGSAPAAEPRVASPAALATETTWESHIGEFWLARVGILALVLGICLLIVYPFAALPAVVPCLIGYSAAAGLFVLARAWQRQYQHLARILFGGAMLLLYFSTLRLHFFSRRPVLENATVGLAVMAVMLVVLAGLATRVQRQFLAGLVMVLAAATALLGQQLSFGLGLILAVSLVAVLWLRRFNWQAQANLAIGLAYLVHLLWLVNNPLLTRAPGWLEQPHGIAFCLVSAATIFAVANCFQYQDDATRLARIIRTIFNATGLVVLGNLIGWVYWQPQLAVVNLGLHIFLMLTATLYWLHRQSRYSTSIYACYGYLALSAAIFAHFEAPAYFTWLTWQSLLVAVTAVWFRSKIVVVVNVLIYLGILAVYIGRGPVDGAVNLSLALVALISARILNWQKARLELRTELMRNTYLVAATVIVLFGLWHAVPGQWVSVSWLGAALAYFLLSLLLHNRKYRWMAIATIMAAALHALVIDLARLEPVFRIVSFLAVGVVLLVVSLFYARQRMKGK